MNKDICVKKCGGIDNDRLNMPDRWALVCVRLKEFVDIEGEPPVNCPYKLEHLLTKKEKEMVMAKTITEEMKVHEEWYKIVDHMTLDTLPEFLKKLLNDYKHDYGTICHAIVAGALATAWAMNHDPNGRLSGAQASFIPMKFYQEWSKIKGLFKIVRYENMLYPQKAEEFEKTIYKEDWDWLQEEAKKKLDKYASEEFEETVHPDVKAHWESIVAGNVPFGYEIRE